jgi:hypothetical protein
VNSRSAASTSSVRVRAWRCARVGASRRRLEVAPDIRGVSRYVVYLSTPGAAVRTFAAPSNPHTVSVPVKPERLGVASCFARKGAAAGRLRGSSFGPQTAVNRRHFEDEPGQRAVLESARLQAIGAATRHARSACHAEGRGFESHQPLRETPADRRLSSSGSRIVRLFLRTPNGHSRERPHLERAERASVCRRFPGAST